MVRIHPAASVVFTIMCLGVLACSPGAAWAGDEPAASEGTSPADTPAENAAKEAEDRYAMPQTEDPKQLLEFIQKVQKYRPQSAADALEHRRKALAAIKTAAERICSCRRMLRPRLTR